MKSVGEAIAIGRTFKESLQNSPRLLEIGRSGMDRGDEPWRLGTEVYAIAIAYMQRHQPQNKRTQGCLACAMETDV